MSEEETLRCVKISFGLMSCVQHRTTVSFPGPWFSSQKPSSPKRGQKYPFPSKATGTVQPDPPLAYRIPALSDMMCLSLYLTQLLRMQKRSRHVLQGLKGSRRKRKKVGEEDMKKEMRDITGKCPSGSHDLYLLSQSPRPWPRLHLPPLLSLRL